jgi:hypothetical protein
MPQKSQENQKGSSPSPVIQEGIDQAWGQQNKDTTTAQQAISQQHNQHPVTPPKK